MWNWFIRAFDILMPSQNRQPGEISRIACKHNKLQFDMHCEQLDTRSDTPIHAKSAQRDKQRPKSS
ncbi:hypothetical protein [Shewanella sp. FJAT-52076]|uniref:hypothetical protein n=1 Tax=Shewanella sp. FJAT-52076 TaxID=2864202 RepID=UPI001C6582C1|nr:hypothetical protein [Shewanella sp. FJAT-52076]QYJ73990.1 hypothetical protein K0H79_11360 [Shewanella sp. FJAT-52076]